MSRVWFRPKGSMTPTGYAVQFDLWYREGPTGRPQCTIYGRTDWTNHMDSQEFRTLHAMLTSGCVTLVKDVGLKTPFDDDLDVDEGL